MKMRSGSISSNSNSQQSSVVDPNAKSFKVSNRSSLKKGESYFARGNYVKATLSFTSHLDKIKQGKIPEYTDDDLIDVHEKLGDSLVMMSGEDEKALENYKCAIDLLRKQKKSVENGRTENESGDDAEVDEKEKGARMKKFNKRFSQVLVNCGNLYMKMSKERNSKEEATEDQKLIELCDSAVGCYKEALPMVKKTYGHTTSYSMTLAHRYCTAKELLSKKFLAKGMNNMAISQLGEAHEILIPYMEAISKSKKEENRIKQYDSLEFIFLKITITLGHTYLQQSRFHEVLVIFKSTVVAMGFASDDVDDIQLRQVKPKNKELLCNIFHNIGIVCQKLDQNGQAIVYFKKVILSKGHNDPTIGNSIQGLGETYFTLSQYDQALHYLLKAKELQQIQLATKNYKLYQLCLSKISTIYEKENKVHESIQHLKDNIELAERCLKDDKKYLEVASISERIGIIQSNTCMYEKALTSHQRSLSCREEAGSNEGIAKSHVYIAENYAELHQYEDAYHSYKTSLLFIESEYDKITIYYKMGDLMTKVNRKKKAIECYKSCVSLSSQLAPRDDSSSNETEIIPLKAQIKVGSLSNENGNYIEALHSFEQARLLLNENAIEDNAQITIGMARAHFGLCNFDLSQRYFMECKQILKTDENLYDYHDIKECFLTIATTYERKGKVEQGIQQLREMIYFLKAIQDKQLFDKEMAGIFHAIGSIQLRHGRYDSAVESYNQALDTKKQAYSIEIENDEHFCNEDMSITIEKLGHICEKQGMNSEALGYYEQSLSGFSGVQKALVHCEVGKLQILLGYSHERIASNFNAALNIVDNTEVHKDNEEKLMLIFRYLGAFRATEGIYDEAVDYYAISVEMVQGRLGRYAEALPAHLRDSGYCFEDDARALEFICNEKKSFGIDVFCMKYDDYKTLAEAISKQYIKSNDLESCIICLKALVNLALMLLTDEFLLDREIALIFHRIGTLQYRSRSYDDALESHDLSLSFKLVYNVDDGENSDISTTYRCIAFIYSSKRMYQEALNNLRESLKGIDIEEKIYILDKMALILCEMKNYTDAIETYKAALRICTPELSEKFIYLLNNLGNVYLCAGDNDSALEWYQKALGVRLSNENSETDMKNIYYSIAAVYLKKKSHDLALLYLKQYLTLTFLNTSSSSFSSVDSTDAAVLNSIGNILFEQNNYGESIEWYQSSLSILESLSSPCNFRKAGHLANLGYAHCLNGSYSTAMELMDKSLENKMNEKQQVHIYEKCGVIYYKMKNYDSALELYQKAIKMKRRIGAAEAASSSQNKEEHLQDVDLSSTQHNIALIYCKKQDFKQALILLEQVLSTKTNTYGENHPEVAKTLMDVGSISIKMKSFKKAEALYLRASKILNKSKFSSKHPYFLQYKNVMKIIKKIVTS